MRLHVLAICLLVITLTQSFEYNILKITISEDSTFLNTFVTEKTWKEAAISVEKRKYTESVFSRSVYQRECEHEVQLNAVYFHPGQKVRIQCVMCDVALVLNGSPKSWARIRNIDRFIENSRNLNEAEMVQNVEFMENKNISPNPRQLGEPYYYQEDGFLVIEEANVYSQGVYFCVDEDSIASQRYFHILIPILPPVYVSKEHKDDIKQISGGCSDSERTFPNHFWYQSYEREFFDDQETCFARNGLDDWSCYDYRVSNRSAGCENPASSCRAAFSAGSLPEEVSLSVSLHWSPWSECNKRGEQKRIGQCFLTLDKPLTRSVPEMWSWLEKLNRLMDVVTFRDGIPLFSGLLTNWLYEVDSLESCLDTELGEKSNIYGYDEFFVNVLESVVNINTTDELATPENAFKYCFRLEKIDEKYDALIGTHTEDVRNC